MRTEGPILVPLDGSELAEAALPYAEALASALNAPLSIVCVSEPAEPGLQSSFPSVADEIEQKSREHVTSYLKDLPGRRPSVAAAATSVRRGHAADEILAAAKESGARMIVIATHGRSGIGRWLYGSTASALLHSAPLPIVGVGPHVLANAPKVAAIKRIVVPLDGSKMSEAALPVAADLAKSLGARITLVRAVMWMSMAYTTTGYAGYTPELDADVEDAAKKYLHDKAQPLRASAEVDAFVLRGPIADALITAVEQHHGDLVVMATQARIGLARAALGSTADRMLQGPAPVLLLPPDAAAA